MAMVKGRSWRGRRKVVSVILLMALTLCTLGAGVHAKADVTTTKGTVSFKEGDLNMFTDATGSMLNFDFGEHFLPVSKVSYPAENDKKHLLSVEDGRAKNGNWQVTVAMTSFTPADGSLINPAFEATINLKDPTVYNKNAAAGTNGLTANTNISVTSNTGEQRVMEADATLERGVYTMEWTNENVTLNISDSQVFLLELERYSALVSWTLTLGPR